MQGLPLTANEVGSDEPTPELPKRSALPYR